MINDFKSTSDISEIKDIVKMKGYSDAYRIKIKDYRLGFYLKRSIVVLAVFKKREDIYKVFP
ncbi:MAG: type II toxin-antitoxin system RelE/ParE family toxin [Flavobacteriaceae bacterium]|nr:type II toxin-antitoxin system RelE/ParE family toxin [Flavobacteriaceae bacterium]